MSFEFLPRSIGVRESFWKFIILEQNICIPFLLAGFSHEPQVHLSVSHINFKSLLVGESAIYGMATLTAEKLHLCKLFIKKWLRPSRVRCALWKLLIGRYLKCLCRCNNNDQLKYFMKERHLGNETWGWWIFTFTHWAIPTHVTLYRSMFQATLTCERRSRHRISIQFRTNKLLIAKRTLLRWLLAEYVLCDDYLWDYNFHYLYIYSSYVQPEGRMWPSRWFRGAQLMFSLRVVEATYILSLFW